MCESFRERSSFDDEKNEDNKGNETNEEKEEKKNVRDERIIDVVITCILKLLQD